MKKIRNNITNEQGLVSIVVVGTIVILLSLITIGFAKLMDRELRQALDRELSSQAYYAAESGLNDTRAYVLNAVSGGSNISKVTDCKAPDSPQFFVDSISGSYTASTSDDLVKYSCVLIDPTPKELVYDVKVGDSTVFRMLSASSLKKLFFSWENKKGSANRQPLSGSPHTLPKESAITDDNTGALRVTVYPVPAALGANPNATLTTAARNYFFYPNGASSAGSVGTSTYASNGVFVDGNCFPSNSGNPPNYLPFQQATGRYCNSAIDNLDTSGAEMYFVRLTALYQDLSVSIQGQDGGGSAIAIKGAEAVVDVTGVGNDILRRVQARVPLSPVYDYPNYTVQSLQTLCKRLRLPATAPGVFGDAQTDLGSSDNSDGACLP